MHLDSLFRFVKQPGLPADDNPVERVCVLSRTALP